MTLFRKLVIGFYIFCIKCYKKIRKVNPKLVPAIPLEKEKTKPLFTLMTKLISSQFDPIIKNELSYYLKHHYELEDLQESLGIASWLEFIKKTEDLEGDIIELGIYKGGTTTLTAHFLKKINSKRKIYACDAFIGLPYDDKFSSSDHAKGKFSDTNSELVLKKFNKFEVSDNIILIKGLFEETLFQTLSDKKFSLVLIDCDVYDATKIALEFVYPRLIKNGIIMFDDYEKANKNNPLWGETRAVDEFFSKKNIQVNTFPEPHIIKS
jgi:hypothetical protein